MITVQLDAMSTQMLRDLGTIAEDEGMMKRAARYLHKLAKELTDDPTKMSKEEFYAMIERAEAAHDRGECEAMLPDEDLTTFLRRLGHDV